MTLSRIHIRLMSWHELRIMSEACGLRQVLFRYANCSSDGLENEGKEIELRGISRMKLDWSEKVSSTIEDPQHAMQTHA